MKHTPSRTAPLHRLDLTQVELRVLSGVARGHSNAEIAARMGIKEQTVKNHVSVLLQKLHVRNRVQLAVLAVHEWPEVISGGSD